MEFDGARFPAYVTTVSNSRIDLDCGICHFAFLFGSEDVANNFRCDHHCHFGYWLPRKKNGTTYNFVAWKFGSALLLILALTLVPILKLGFSSGSAMVSLVIGCLFTAALATCFGILTSNPKTFIVLFGMFWYLVLNDGGKNPSIDFAGWYGVATPSIQLVYFGLAAGTLVVTYALNAFQMKRSY